MIISSFLPTCSKIGFIARAFCLARAMAAGRPPLPRNGSGLPLAAVANRAGFIALGLALARRSIAGRRGLGAFASSRFFRDVSGILEGEDADRVPLDSAAFAPVGFCHTRGAFLLLFFDFPGEPLGACPDVLPPPCVEDEKGPADVRICVRQLVCLYGVRQAVEQFACEARADCRPQTPVDSAPLLRRKQGARRGAVVVLDRPPARLGVDQSDEFIVL